MGHESSGNFFSQITAEQARVRAEKVSAGCSEDEVKAAVRAVVTRHIEGTQRLADELERAVENEGIEEPSADWPMTRDTEGNGPTHDPDAPYVREDALTALERLEREWGAE